MRLYVKTQNEGDREPSFKLVGAPTEAMLALLRRDGVAYVVDWAFDAVRYTLHRRVPRDGRMNIGRVNERRVRSVGRRASAPERMPRFRVVTHDGLVCGVAESCSSADLVWQRAFAEGERGHQIERFDPSAGWVRLTTWTDHG